MQKYLSHHVNRPLHIYLGRKLLIASPESHSAIGELSYYMPEKVEFFASILQSRYDFAMEKENLEACCKIDPTFGLTKVWKF